MRHFFHVSLVLLLAWAAPLFGQDGGLPVGKTFRDTRIVNAHSTELSPKGTLKFIVSHRFDKAEDGAYDLFGMDDAVMRLGLDYAPTEWLNVGVGRSSLDKTFDFFAKARLLRQREGGSPVTLAYYGNAAINSLRPEDYGVESLTVADRMTYVHQALASRKLTPSLSLQLMPTYVHRNLIDPEFEASHDVYALGAAGRWQISRTFALNLEYFYLQPEDGDKADYEDTFGVGFEIETKGHVFQLNFSNSRGIAAPYYLNMQSEPPSFSNLHFGFNITRDFKLGSRQY